MLKLCLFSLFCMISLAFAGVQPEEVLAPNVASVMHRSVFNINTPRLVFDNSCDSQDWLTQMSSRLIGKIPDKWVRERLLTAIQYEAARAGLDPQLVLSVIDVESGFHKYAISSAGARGLMQVMPFWVRTIGIATHNLFDLTTNLRYGCTILRYYLDKEQGNLVRALGRYNGSLGKPDYVAMVVRAWQGRWRWNSRCVVFTLQ